MEEESVSENNKTNYVMWSPAIIAVVSIVSLAGAYGNRLNTLEVRMEKNELQQKEDSAKISKMDSKLDLILWRIDPNNASRTQ